MIISIAAQPCPKFELLNTLFVISSLEYHAVDDGNIIRNEKENTISIVL
jgi:hypothetical protein